MIFKVPSDSNRSVIHVVFRARVDNNCDELAPELISPLGFISKELKYIQKGQSLTLDHFSSHLWHV